MFGLTAHGPRSFLTKKPAYARSSDDEDEDGAKSKKRLVRATDGGDARDDAPKVPGRGCMHALGHVPAA